MDIYGSSTKAKEILGWKYDKDFFNVMDIIIKEELEAFSEKNS
jgi:GDPmannose 4,6-dehydratase